MLGQRRRRWTNIATLLFPRAVIASSVDIVNDSLMVIDAASDAVTAASVSASKHETLI